MCAAPRSPELENQIPTDRSNRKNTQNFQRTGIKLTRDSPGTYSGENDSDPAKTKSLQKPEQWISSWGPPRSRLPELIPPRLAINDREHPTCEYKPGVFILLRSHREGNYDSCGRDDSDKLLANNKAVRGSQSAILTKGRSTPFCRTVSPYPPCLASGF
jgi:hypothetical protein